jgi:hypothetical protein
MTAWLVRDSEVLASLDIAETFGARLRGLLGQGGVDGALMLRPAKSVHTMGMRFSIDVAFVDRELQVIDVIVAMRPNRMSRVRARSSAVIEAEAGAFERWRLLVGDQLEIR